MKKIITLSFVLALLALSGSLSAQDRKKGEIHFGGGLFFALGDSHPFGTAILGYTSRFIGAEVSGAYPGGILIITANLVAGLFHERQLIPYVTGGIVTTTEGGFSFNAGAGFKIRLSQALAIRAEYRRYFMSWEWGFNSVGGGISLFF